MKQMMILCLVCLLAGCRLHGNFKRTVITEPLHFKEYLAEKTERKRYRRLAADVYQKTVCVGDRKFRKLDDSPYAEGFLDGFVEYMVAGGTVEAPFLPPRKYWNKHHQNLAGHRAAHEWFSGYEHGALSARDGGYRELITIPTLPQYYSYLQQQSQFANPSDPRPSNQVELEAEAWDESYLEMSPVPIRPDDVEPPNDDDDLDMVPPTPEDEDSSPSASDKSVATPVQDHESSVVPGAGQASSDLARVEASLENTLEAISVNASGTPSSLEYRDAPHETEAPDSAEDSTADQTKAPVVQHVLPAASPDVDRRDDSDDLAVTGAVPELDEPGSPVRDSLTSSKQQRRDRNVLVLDSFGDRAGEIVVKFAEEVDLQRLETGDGKPTGSLGAANPMPPRDEEDGWQPVASRPGAKLARQPGVKFRLVEEPKQIAPDLADWRRHALKKAASRTMIPTTVSRAAGAFTSTQPGIRTVSHSDEIPDPVRSHRPLGVRTSDGPQR